MRTWKTSSSCMPDMPADPGYQLQISDAPDDVAWDDFLAETPAGHHVQTSSWGQLKTQFGGYAVRVIARLNGRIVGGAQMLVRFFPPLGAVGYVPKGPLIIGGDPALAGFIIHELHRLARQHHVQYLVVQPPDDDTVFVENLENWGFKLCPIEIAPSATTRIDLTSDLDEIFARMQKTTRKRVRRALREGLAGREGTECDLPTFYRLLEKTSQRQGFSAFSEAYYSDMWHLLQARDYIRLFLVEYEGEAISAEIVITFGDTVWAKVKGWSGDYAQSGPNYLMDWTIMEWAKAKGYRWYDLEGIEPNVARAVLRTNHQSEEIEHGPSKYKLGFGGQVVLCPGAYEYVYNPVLRWGREAIFPRVQDCEIVKRFANRLRTA
jgi:peptidoglycan pentaglycine glycine transferase (the first glycine)